MKLALILSLISLNAFALSGYDCEGQNCQRREILVDESKPSGLLDFGDSKEFTKPQKLGEGDKLPNQNLAVRGSDLKFHQLYHGQCLIDPQTSTYYKIVEKRQDRDNQIVSFVIEVEDHNNSLTGRRVFYNSDESAAFRKLRTFDCNQTPHLADNKYIQDCTAGVKIGNFLCTPDKFNR